jgi:hypothetical protein
MKDLVWPWIGTAVTMFAFFGLLGWIIKKKPLGILVDFRHRVSLSQLQVIVWTVLITSAVLVYGVSVGTTNIYLAPEIWALLGVTLGSAAGSVIVKGTKAGKDPDPLRTSQAGNPRRMGVLAVDVARKPQLADMFSGEELDDEKYVDIGKVQMFFFTIALVIMYCGALWDHNFTDVPDGVSPQYDAYFPILSSAMVALLGISHTGYLTIKAAPSTPTKH